MGKSKIIYQEKSHIYAKYYHPQSDEFLEYDTTLKIKDSCKQPIVIRMKYATFPTSFTPMPPEEHIIRAKDIAELVLKLNRWFAKYGYKMY